jgi:Ca2+-binding EF-hand superfamily protein
MKYLLLILMVFPLACDTLSKYTEVRIADIEQKLQELDQDNDGKISLTDLLMVLGGAGVIGGGGAVLAKKVNPKPAKKKS